MNPILLLTLLLACAKQSSPSHSKGGEADTTFTSLASSSSATCVRDTDGLVSCWGWNVMSLFGATEIPEDNTENYWGVLRIGPGIPEPIYVTLHTLCWLEDDLDVGCLGGSFWGYELPKVKKFVPMTAGYMAILPDGTIETEVPWKVNVPEQTVDIVAADLYTCFGLSDGTWDCSLKSPVGPQVSIDIMVDSWCALSATGEVQCWNTLNDGEELNFVDGRVDWTEIQMSSSFVCGLTPHRTAECRRDQESADVEGWQGPDLASREPVKMMDCTMYSCCAVLESGALECWGEISEIPDFVYQ